MHRIFHFVPATAAGAVGALLVASGAIADTALGLRASSQGLGVEIASSLGKSVAIRGSINFFPLDFTSSKAGIDYNANVDLASGGVFLDFYPGGGPLRLTGGLIVDKNKATVTAVNQPSFTIGNQTFTEAEVGRLSGSVRFRDATPYVGIGLGNPFRGGKWAFTLDVGVFLLDPRVSLNSTGGSLSNDPTLLAEIERERAQFEDAISDLPVFPVIGIALTRRF